MTGPLKWYGGKGMLAPRIVKLFPRHQTYVEAFAGGAACLFAKPPSPVEVLNDIDDDLVRFYRVLRDEHQCRRLAEQLALTPYSRREYRDCMSGPAESLDDVERVRRWYVSVRQSFGGRPGAGWSYSVDQSCLGRSKQVSAWLSAIEGLPAVCARLRGVQVEHLHWRELLPTYDGPRTLFYLDPPYIHGTRSKPHAYTHEMSDEDHEEFVDTLLGLRGMVLLSGYVHPLYAPLERARWQRLDSSTVCHAQRGAQKTDRVESIWVSPSAIIAPRMDQLFDTCA